MLRSLALPLALYLLWRLYVAQNFVGGEFAIRPISQWWFALAGDVIARMARIASQKGGYFGVMLIALGIAIWRVATIRTPFDQLAVLAAHGLALLWSSRARWRLPRAAPTVAICVALVLPVALASKLRFDLRAPKIYVRSVGAEIATILPRNARLAILDPTDNGFYIEVMRYTLHGTAQIVASVSSYNRAGADEIRALLAQNAAGFVWVHVPTAIVRAELEVPLMDGASYLLSRGEGGWSVVRSWPYPGYRVPSVEAD